MHTPLQTEQTPSQYLPAAHSSTDVTKGLASHRQQLWKHSVISTRGSKAESIPETAH